MPYKVKNISDDPRQFREHKTIAAHFLRAGEECIVQNKPAIDRPDIFEITEIHNSEMKEESVPRTEIKMKGGLKNKR
jgi:hypothetical protein